jgi:hypothetical protein
MVHRDLVDRHLANNRIGVGPDRAFPLVDVLLVLPPGPVVFDVAGGTFSEDRNLGRCRRAPPAGRLGPPDEEVNPAAEAGAQLGGLVPRLAQGLVGDRSESPPLVLAALAIAEQPGPRPCGRICM